MKELLKARKLRDGGGRDHGRELVVLEPVRLLCGFPEARISLNEGIFLKSY